MAVRRTGPKSAFDSIRKTIDILEVLDSLEGLTAPEIRRHVENDTGIDMGQRTLQRYLDIMVELCLIEKVDNPNRGMVNQHNFVAIHRYRALVRIERLDSF